MLITDKDNKLNIDFNKDYIPDITFYKDIYGSHMKLGDRTFGDCPKTNKVEDFLYQMDIDKMDENFSNTYWRGLGACSSIRSGNYCIRSYDWNYNNNVEFLLHTLPAENRHESIGTASSNLTNADMELGDYKESYKSIPFRLLDGINDCGVFCSINVVPHGDYGQTIGTNGGAKDLPNVSIPRFILDNATSVDEAVKLLKSRNIFSVVYDGEPIELHVLIADKNKTVVVEFINNQMIILDNEYMTNFYLYNWNGEIKTGYNGNPKEEIDNTGLTPHAQGLERYKIIQDSLPIETDEQAKELLNKLIYTNAYKESTNPFWYSEFSQVRPEITIYSTAEEFEDLKQTAIDYYEKRSRDTGLTWQSVHQSYVNLDTLEYFVSVQEQSDSWHGVQVFL